MMEFGLQVFLIVCVFIYLAIIIQLLRKKKLNLRYTLIWLLAATAMLVMGFFPNLVVALTGLVGIQIPSNFVFVIEGIFVLMILLSLTSIVSNLSNKVLRLTQTQALLEKRIRDLEQKQEDKEE